MATIQSVKAKIQGLIDKSNEATGGSDTDLTTAIDNLIANQGGGGALVEKAFNFWDYDGTLLYSYTYEEMQALTELPPAPIHNELDHVTFSKWSEDLANIKVYPAFLDVFAFYKPTDTTTYGSEASLFYVDIAIPKEIKLYCYKSSSSDTAYVNWGDGTIEEITGTSSSSTLTHTYATKGKYTITLSRKGTGYLYFGGGSNTTPFISDTCCLLSFSVSSYYHRASKYAFYQSYRLEKAYVYYGGQYMFQNCGNLRIVRAGTGFSAYALSNCRAIKRLTWDCNTSNSMTGTNVYTLQHIGGVLNSFTTGCRTLVIKTGGSVFNNNSGVDISAMGTEVYVWQSVLSSYKSNSTWSSCADRIYSLNELNRNELVL